MSTLEDLARSIDAAAEAQVASVTQIQGVITQSLAKSYKLSIEDLNNMPIFGYGLGVDILYGLATTIRATLLARAQLSLLNKVVSNITPAASISLSAGQPVKK
jgi:hypothetical protein